MPGVNWRDLQDQVERPLRDFINLPSDRNRLHLQPGNDAKPSQLVQRKVGMSEGNAPAREGFPGSGIGNYCATKSHFPREPGTDKDAANLFVGGQDLFPLRAGELDLLPARADVSHRQ